MASARLNRLLQNLIILIVRPYTIRELPGWGKIYNLVADYRKDGFWASAAPRTISDKNNGLKMHLDLGKWSDRSNYFLGRWYDLEIALVTRDLVKKGGTVVDVGANRGEFSLMAALAVGDTGKVISFEPNPNCRDMLTREVAANGITNLTVVPAALGDVEQTLSLSVPVEETYYGTFSTSAFADDETYEVEAHVRIGDTELADEEPAIIKIDVEGFETHVLRGMRATIDRSRPIIVTEVIERTLNACGSSVTELTALMTGYGYLGYWLGVGRKRGVPTWRATAMGGPQITEDAIWVHRDSELRRIIDEHDF